MTFSGNLERKFCCKKNVGRICITHEKPLDFFFFFLKLYMNGTHLVIVGFLFTVISV